MCLSFDSFVKSSVLQERPEEHRSVREVESLHNSSHNVDLEDCFRLYTKDEKVCMILIVTESQRQNIIVAFYEIVCCFDNFL